MPHMIPSLLLGLLFVASTSAQEQPGLRWFKGNTHTHTSNSDGDSRPDVVVKWYRDHKYNFVFITDHEFITPVGPLNKVFGVPGEFEVMSGQEVTDSFDKKPYHVNALGIDRVTMPRKAKGAAQNLQENVDAIRLLGAVPQVNHPNFGWALTAPDITRLRNVRLMEIYNGHPLVNNLGGGGAPGVEAIWDAVLSAGITIYGTATDDAHFFKRLGDRTAPTPGQGWVYVRAASLSPAAILAALDRGDFYASTGVELATYTANAQQITIGIHPERWSKYSVQFIGRHGRVLETVFSDRAVYRIRGNEGYVRARIMESNGKMAWTQPVTVPGK